MQQDCRAFSQGFHGDGVTRSSAGRASADEAPGPGAYSQDGAAVIGARRVTGLIPSAPAYGFSQSARFKDSTSRGPKVKAGMDSGGAPSPVQYDAAAGLALTRPTAPGFSFGRKSPAQPAAATVRAAERAAEEEAARRAVLPLEGDVSLAPFQSLGRQLTSGRRTAPGFSFGGGRRGGSAGSTAFHTPSPLDYQGERGGISGPRSARARTAVSQARNPPGTSFGKPAKSQSRAALSRSDPKAALQAEESIQNKLQAAEARRDALKKGGGRSGAVVGRAAPAYSFGTKPATARTARSDSPGPAAYTPTPSTLGGGGGPVLRSRTAFTGVRNQRLARDVLDTPAPGAYGIPDPVAARRRNVPSARFGLSPSATSRGRTQDKQGSTRARAPRKLKGAAGAQQKRAAALSTWKARPSEESPGPGTYQPDMSPVKPAAPAFSLRGKARETLAKPATADEEAQVATLRERSQGSSTQSMFGRQVTHRSAPAYGFGSAPARSGLTREQREAAETPGPGAFAGDMSIHSFREAPPTLAKARAKAAMQSRDNLKKRSGKSRV